MWTGDALRWTLREICRKFLHVPALVALTVIIRGFLVPEPAMISLLTLGLGLGFVSLRRKNTGEDSRAA